MEKLWLMAPVEYSPNGKGIMASIKYTLMVYSPHVPSWLSSIRQWHLSTLSTHALEYVM